IGKFVDRERPSWIECYNERHGAALGPKFTPYPVGNTPRVGGGDGEDS
ncbi:MAG: hypothetical protein HY906_19090, partial [Deltaproteobacteria bacterium]|nr:hypothetical protein [Deltaproteobacteria bacterium]